MDGLVVDVVFNSMSFIIRPCDGRMIIKGGVQCSTVLVEH